MVRSPSRLLLVMAVGLALGIPADTHAHWCSNIYNTYARIVVKPERQNINISTGQSGELRVRVRNNFPYTLNYVQLRANPPAELEVTVSPTATEAQNKRIYAGQDATFTLTITRNSNGSDDVSVLGLEVNFRVETVSGWKDESNRYLDQSPDPAEVRNTLANNPDQSYSLLNADLADIDGCAGCETEGVNGLMALWRDRVDRCDTASIDSQWPQIFMRSGHQLAIRLRFRNFNDPGRGTVVSTMIYGMDNPYPIARGLAAFYAAYGGNDTGVQARVQQMADSDADGGNCTYSANNNAQIMAKAGLLILGESQHQTEIENCVNNGGLDNRARMACAAALGIMGDDQPVTDYLIPAAGTGTGTDYTKLVGSYLLQLVVYSRRGGPDGVGPVSFLDEDVVEDNTAPAAPTGFTVQPL
jgi:hypothetical protein